MCFLYFPGCHMILYDCLWFYYISRVSRRRRRFLRDLEALERIFAFFKGGNFYLCSLLVAHAYSNAHMGGRPPLGLNRGALLPLSERPLLRMSGKPLLQMSGRPLLHMSGKPLLQVARDFLFATISIDRLSTTLRDRFTACTHQQRKNIPRQI